MKLLYLVGIFLLDVMWCNAIEEHLQDISKNSDADEDVFADLKEFFAKKCKNGGEDAFKNLTGVLDHLKTCVGDQLSKNTHELKNLTDSSEESSEDICTDRRGKIRECFEDFVEIWKDCSEPAEKYLPHFVFDAVEAVLDYICADDGAFIPRVINSLDCFLTLRKNNNSTDGCSNKFKILRNDIPENSVITKEELCEDLETATTCYGNFIQEKCPGSEFKDVVVGLYTAISSACDKRHRRSLPLSFRLF